MKGRRDGEQNKTRDVFMHAGDRRVIWRAACWAAEVEARRSGKVFVGAKHMHAFASWEKTFNIRGFAANRKQFSAAGQGCQVPALRS